MKKYLHELNEQELAEIFKNNDNLQNIVINDLIEYDLEAQQEEFENLNIKKYVEVHDHYNTFYLRLKNAIGLFENLCIDYCNQQVIEFYEQSKQFYNDYLNDNEKYDIFVEKMEILVELLDKQLHEYEQGIDFDTALDFFVEEAQSEYGLYANYYTKNDLKVYKETRV